MRTYVASIIGLVLFGILDYSKAKTIAYWRFEEGTKGEEHANDRDGFYLDDSGNGNHLSSWAAQTRPKGTDDLPFRRVPQTGKKNTLALEFDGETGAGDDLVTTARLGGSDKMVDSHLFKRGWTIECSLKIQSPNRWQVFIGKDKSPGSNGEPVFSMKIMADNRMQILFCDDDGNPYWIDSIVPLSTDEWYSVAATYDGEDVELYLKHPYNKEYSKQGLVTPRTRVTLGKWESSWTVGRGMWNGAPTDWFHGVIDEVRISDIALRPKYFLATPR